MYEVTITLVFYGSDLIIFGSFCYSLVCVCMLSPVQVFATPWTAAHQAPLSLGLSMQEDWSRLPFPTPGNLPDWEMEPKSPAAPELAGRFFTTEPSGKPLRYLTVAISSIPVAAKSLQSCPTLCDPKDGSPPGSPNPEILQERTLECVAISFSNAWKWKVKVKLLSRVQLFATPWTAAYQAPPPMGFSRQEYWSGVPLPSPYKFHS